MLIQHILTEEVFAAVFPGTPFHQDNNVARELYKLEANFFKGDTKFQTLKGMAPYYAAIRSAAAQIGTHHEKHHLRARCNAKEILDSGLRRNYERKSRLLVDEFRSPAL